MNSSKFQLQRNIFRVAQTLINEENSCFDRIKKRMVELKIATEMRVQIGGNDTHYPRIWTELVYFWL